MYIYLGKDLKNGVATHTGLQITGAFSVIFLKKINEISDNNIFKFSLLYIVFVLDI